jgi:hypothetical protein
MFPVSWFRGSCRDHLTCSTFPCRSGSLPCERNAVAERVRLDIRVRSILSFAGCRSGYRSATFIFKVVHYRWSRGLRTRKTFLLANDVGLFRKMPIFKSLKSTSDILEVTLKLQPECLWQFPTLKTADGCKLQYCSVWQSG